jgi:PAS domain S-box-containing protein
MSEARFFDALPAGFYHAILNSIRDPFNIIDRNYRILWANKARARFHEQNLKDMIGKRCYEMFQRRSEPCTECPARVVFQTGKPCIMERSAVMPDGTRKWGNVRVYPVFDEKGNVMYAIQIMIDITKRKISSIRQKRHIESLETTIQELNGNNVRGLLKHDGGEEQSGLTARETEILGLVANGFSNIEIGKILSISAHTVKSHVMHIFDKLGVRDRTQAAVWAVRHRLN